MSIQYVNIGTNPNDGTGDDLRSAFLKVNDNFQLLATIGGETNYGTNLGGGSGQVYAGKTNESLNFRTLAAGAGVALDQVGNVITIRNTYSSPASFTKIYDDAGNYYEAQAPGASLRILGTGSISTQIIGNELTVAGSFSLFSDPDPKISTDLDLNGHNLTGTGNITHVGTILTDGLTVGRSTGPGNYPSVTLLNGSLTVKAASTLAAVTATTVNASTSITAPIFNSTGNGFVGNLTGNTTGTHYGNVAIRGLGEPDTIVVNAATDPATITGSHVGTFSGGLTGTLITGGLDLNNQNVFGNGSIYVQTPATSELTALHVRSNRPSPEVDVTLAPTIDDSKYTAALFEAPQTASGLSPAIRVRAVSRDSNQTVPNGSGISFESVNEDITTSVQPSYIYHGDIGILTYDEREAGPNNPYTNTNYSTFVVRLRSTPEAEPQKYLKNALIVRGNGIVTMADLTFIVSTIRPRPTFDFNTNSDIPSINDLIIKTDSPDTYVNFYGDYGLTGDGSAVSGYSFPREIGTPGQVLAVRTPDGINPNHLLEWVTPSGIGGGGGSTTLLGLADTPNTYAAGDGGKILVVKGDLSGIEFTNTITASLIGNVTGNVTGNASTATALQNTRTINGKNFNGTQNVTLTTADIGENTNLYFTNSRVYSAFNIPVGSSLAINTTTGEISLAESTANVPNTLVKRDENGDTILGLLKVSTLQKNASDTAITVGSRLETSGVISSTEDIITTNTVSAGFISLTGSGDQTLASSGKLILSPATSVDVSGKKIVNLSIDTPTADSDAATKKYVDDRSTFVYDASLQNFPLTGDTGGSLTVIKNTTVTISGSNNINTSTTVNGVQVSLKSTISGISVTGNLPISGTATANVVKAGNINITNNEIQQTVTGNNINIVPGSSGGSVIVTGGDFKLTNNSRFFVTGTNIVEVAANSLEVEIPVTTPFTFVRTLNWVDDNAALAYAFMNDGTQGQTKTIIMLDRGNFGNALDTRPRYLVLRGKFNGSSRTINIAASDPNGSSTFVFLDGFWWRTSHVA